MHSIDARQSVTETKTGFTMRPFISFGIEDGLRTLPVVFGLDAERRDVDVRIWRKNGEWTC